MPSLQVSGSRVEYLERGSGEAVVLLHSSGSSGAQWRALADGLSARYRVVAPDLYGYGATAPWPGRGAFSLAHEAEIVHALLERIGEPAHLVGHSYGGAVALHVARLRGELLHSLTAIEPVAFHLLKDRAEIAALAERVSRALACGDYVGGFGSFVDYWSGPGSWNAIPAAKRGAMAARLSKVALDFHAVLSEPAGPDAFRRVAAPTLVVRGERTPLPTQRICGLLGQILPDSSLITVNGAGHMAPLTHATQVNALIAAHLNAKGGRNETHQHHAVDSRNGLREYRTGTR
jgi:pimeloyl-ACP methyl ester carboxylesterase